MTNRERSKFDSYDRVAQFNTSNAALLATIPGYAAEETIFNSANAAGRQALAAQEMDNSGLATASLLAKTNMAQTLTRFALRALVIAKRTGNAALTAELNHGITYISTAPKLVAIQRANDVLSVITGNISLFITITPADVTAISNSIATYSSAEAQPVIARQNKTISGTDVIAAAVKNADEAIDHMLDLIYSYFIVSNLSLVDAFKLARHVIATGTHHTGLQVEVSLAQQNNQRVTSSVENIQVKIVELNKIALTDHSGTAQIERVKPGTYNVEFSGTGIATQTQSVTITRGHLAHANVLLQIAQN